MSMKKIFTLIAIVASSALYAQNNLQFNAAKYIKIIINPGQYVKDSIITVPANKVWKIEGGSLSANTSYLYLDDAVILANPKNVSNTLPFTPFPIWLPSGTYTLSLGTWNFNSGSAFVSAIEFNITQ